MVAIVAFSAVCAAQVGERSIRDYLQPSIRDLQITAQVVKNNPAELRKINKDYVQNYAIDSSTIWFEDPFKLRVDSRIEDTTGSFIYNGSTLLIHVPSLRLNKREDLSSTPARRETVLDFGLLLPSLFDTFFNAKFIRMDRETGDPVFDITYSDKTEGARYRIWIDPVHHIVQKREWYNRYGTQLATFIYDHAKEVGGIWIPTMITVKNVDNQVAGATRYDSIKVNSGLASNIFSVK